MNSAQPKLERGSRARALFLTRDPELVTRQLAGFELSTDQAVELCASGGLLDDVSTDEIAPAWASYFFDERLAQRCLTGLRGGSVGERAIFGQGFEVVVAGEQFGSGSSRETAPFALLLSGVRWVVARSFAPIFRKNADNVALFTACDFSLLRRWLGGEALTSEALVAARDSLTREILLAGGLLEHARARPKALSVPRSTAPARTPRTLVEKIIAAHAVSLPPHGELRPGDTLSVRVDRRFSHEYVTPMAEALFVRSFGEDARVADPESVLLFRDHLTLAEAVHGRDPRRLPLLDATKELARAQAAFAERQKIKLFGELGPELGIAGSRAICHEEIWEGVALPGEVVVGSDSHTSTAGAVGCFAFGVGASEMAALWVTPETRLAVPESVRVTLRGRLSRGVAAKDVMLRLFATPLFQSGGARGRVLEFHGDLDGFELGERATLANMSVEAGALTGIVPFDTRAALELASLRGVEANRLSRLAVGPDPDAGYAASVDIDLGSVEPMLALPGDPKDVLPLSALERPVRIDIAYGGSCTGGKPSDFDAYAAVLAGALGRGERVAPGVTLYLQTGSERVLAYARERGYLELFSAIGATLLGPACGACINAGPGASESAEQVTVSAASRNYPGRSGPGSVYLASPAVVAASALAGRLAAPSFDGVEPAA